MPASLSIAASDYHYSFAEQEVPLIPDTILPI